MLNMEMHSLLQICFGPALNSRRIPMRRWAEARDGDNTEWTVPQKSNFRMADDPLGEPFVHSPRLGEWQASSATRAQPGTRG